LIDQQIYSDYDEQQRPRRVTYLDGTFTQTTFGCCGVESVTDRHDLTTSYGYDSLRRKISETRNNITTLYTYDGAAKIVMTTRQGTDASQVVLNKSLYDMAGRLIAETNALGVITTNIYSFDGQGQAVKTTKFALGTPDESTRIETYAKDGRLVKVTGAGVNPVRYDYGVEQETGVYRKFVKEIKLDANFNDTTEWKKTYTDTAGREYKTVFNAASGTPNVQSYFNGLGQLNKQVDPDGVITLFAYNSEGQLQDSVFDTNRNSTIDFAGLDRVNRTVNDVLYNGTLLANVRRTRSIIFPNNNDGTTTQEVSKVETSVDGLKSLRTSFGLISTTVKTVPSGGSWTVTETAPDGSKVISSYQNGRLVTTTRQNASGGQLGQTTFAYDAHGRVASTTDARNGAITYFYDGMDRATNVVTPAPGNGQGAQTTATTYDNIGRVKTVTHPDGTTTTSEFFPTGLPKKTYGSRIYPVEYTYDAQGRMKTMKTWTSFSAGGKVKGSGLKNQIVLARSSTVCLGWVLGTTAPNGTARSLERRLETDDKVRGLRKPLF
jgi:YD repeat-containing protein